MAPNSVLISLIIEQHSEAPCRNSIGRPQGSDSFPRNRTQKRAAVPRWARVSGAQTFVYLNSRLESNKEEEETGRRSAKGAIPGRKGVSSVPRNHVKSR